MIRRGWRTLGVLVLAAAAPTTTMRAASMATAVAPGFSVAVSFSPRAAARMAHPKETIIVWAEFYGDGNGKAKRLQDDMDQVSFAPDRRIELGGAGVAQFPSFKFNPALLGDVDKSGLQVLINVYSGRHSSPNNLLACDIFQDRIALAGSKPIQIHCKLIEET